jgi:hypothetical protein
MFRVMNPLMTLSIIIFSVLGFVLLSVIHEGQVYAQLKGNASSSEPTFLFIQSAQSGSLSQINDTAYRLVLNDVADKTVSFSDRPYRMVESIDTSEFVGNWSTSDDCFAINPPNAALVVLDNSDGAKSSKQDIALVELFNPVYVEVNNALTYDVRPDNATSITLPSEFGQPVMIIDNARVLHWMNVADRLTTGPESNLKDAMHFSCYD